MPKKRKTMSAEQRKNLSDKAKQRWAEKKADEQFKKDVAADFKHADHIAQLDPVKGGEPVNIPNMETYSKTSSTVSLPTVPVPGLDAADTAADFRAPVVETAIDTPPVVPEPITEPEIKGEQNVDQLQAQIAEMRQNQELMMMIIRGQQNGQAPKPTQFNIGGNGRPMGVIEKYIVDPARYPSPVERLMEEPRLAPLAFKFNYEMEYSVDVTSYETKHGVNMSEPRFLVRLNRIVFNKDGTPTNKRYIARQMVFHEDPQAAIVLAREQGIDLAEYDDMDNNDENKRRFLNEMRYLRVKAWLFDIFWPQPVQPGDQLREEVIDGQIVQVFTINSEDSSEIDFTQIKNKMSV